jgi:hypothetical protein
VSGRHCLLHELNQPGLREYCQNNTGFRVKFHAAPHTQITDGTEREQSVGVLPPSATAFELMVIRGALSHDPVPINLF